MKHKGADGMVYSCCDPPTYGNSGTQRWMRTRRKCAKMETTSVLGMNFHHTPGQENKGSSKKNFSHGTSYAKIRKTEMQIEKKLLAVAVNAYAALTAA